MGVFGSITPKVVPCVQPASINDIFLHSLFARVALTDNSTIEFQTKYDPSCNQLELVLPPNAPPIFDKLTGVQQGPNLQAYVNWFVGSNGGGSGSASPLTTKGDLWGFSTVDARIPAGIDGQFLMADSTQPLGVSWAAVSGGGPGSDTTAIHQGGDAFGTDMSIGPTDANDLVFRVNGGAAWRIDKNSHALIPGTDMQLVGTTDNRVFVVASRVNVQYQGAGQANAALEGGTLYLGDGTNPPDFLMHWSAVGTALIPTGSKLQQTDAPTVGADLTNKTYVDSFGPGADVNAWHKTGDSFGADAILGTMDDHALKLYANGQEYGRIVDDGPNVNWTGPRLKIAHTDAAFYPNGDIISIKKDLGDQLCVTMQNTNSNALTPASSTFVMIDDTGTKTGGINLLNSNWGPGDGGVFPGEYLCNAFGGKAVYGTQTDKDIRFIRNEIEQAIFDGGYFYANGCSIRTSGIIKADSDGSTLTIGTAGDPLANGIKAGKAGEYSFVFNYDAGSGFTGTVIDGKASTFARSDIVSGGPSASGFGAWSRLINADGKSMNFFLPESGFVKTSLGEAGFGTIQMSLGYGFRVNVNGLDDAGLSIGIDQTMHVFGSVSAFNVMPEGGDGVGSIGDNSHRWSLIRGVTITSGDLNLEDDDFGSKWTVREAKLEGEDIDSLYAINRRTGQKFKVQLQAI